MIQGEYVVKTAAGEPLYLPATAGTLPIKDTSATALTLTVTEA